MTDMTESKHWILLPPGNKMFCRYPLDEIPPGARIASAAELRVACGGAPFPHGFLPEAPKPTSEKPHRGKIWQELRLGYGGLIHEKWFVTSEGRFGGARNVPDRLPGSLRSCLLFDGGECAAKAGLNENEGYAVVRDICGLCLPDTLDLYRRVQLHAAEHVFADGGAIIVSPIGENNQVWVGFVGRCLECPNPELISFRQLKAAVSGYNFQLWPEWQQWSLSKPAVSQLISLAV